MMANYVDEIFRLQEQIKSLQEKEDSLIQQGNHSTADLYSERIEKKKDLLRWYLKNNNEPLRFSITVL